ncbi:MAG: TdeIII family type II restriction endonuclease [Candidatus Cloacimonetes bacterium HGW-Cloacimonetes-3]|jgi:type II restriction enzyme|nr:MAG: TdeIII family type II restriction endonuclease [Candidatus Cloacimonetes bacterium HGW-Cloacimonetes-3]
MSLSQATKLSLTSVLKASLIRKMQGYHPEASYMPFHTRLLGKDRLALYSFIHSLNTNFGTTIFEPIAKELGDINFVSATSQQVSGKHISSEAHKAIQTIMDNLSTANAEPNKTLEIETIRKVCTQGTMVAVKPTKVDVKLISKSGTIYLIDIKTAKPNAGGFKEFKRTLLEWVAATLADDPKADIHTLIAIPYNPYEPAPYSRWTMRGMLDLDQELKVASEFWDFLGGNGTYQDLLDIFEKVGIELRSEIDAYFSRFVR